MSERSQAQIRAEQLYEMKRKAEDRPRLPGGYLTPEEWKRLNRVARFYSSKKEALMEGLKLLEDKHKGS